MKLKSIFVILVLFFSWNVRAVPSAIRLENEDFQAALTRNTSLQILDSDFGSSSKNAWSVSDKFEKMDFSQIEDLGSAEKLNEIFHFIRDTKFIENLNAPLNERRLTWLFPDDGCYLRAELAGDFVSKKFGTQTFKFFSFGNLAVRTDNRADGIVRWWYHVVPIYRVGNQAYVIDPSIDPRKPMLAEEWKKSMEVDAPVEKFAVCHQHTFGPEESCEKPSEIPIENVLRSQKGFLNQEWRRIQTLGRNPQLELGDTPPWSKE
jgi:hypothetical protein